MEFGWCRFGELAAVWGDVMRGSGMLWVVLGVEMSALVVRLLRECSTDGDKRRASA